MEGHLGPGLGRHGVDFRSGVIYRSFLHSWTLRTISIMPANRSLPFEGLPTQVSRRGVIRSSLVANYQKSVRVKGGLAPFTTQDITTRYTYSDPCLPGLSPSRQGGEQSHSWPIIRLASMGSNAARARFALSLASSTAPRVLSTVSLLSLIPK
jgi:hypothetical protein